MEELTLHCSQKERCSNVSLSWCEKKESLHNPCLIRACYHFSVSCWKTVATQWVCKAILGDAAFADCAVHVVSGIAYSTGSVL